MKKVINFYVKDKSIKGLVDNGWIATIGYDSRRDIETMLNAIERYSGWNRSEICYKIEDKRR